MKNLPVVWTSHLQSQEKREYFSEVVRNSHEVLSRLRDIMEDQLEMIEQEEVKESFYSEPNLIERMVFNNGQKAQLRKALQLLSFL